MWRFLILFLYVLKMEHKPTTPPPILDMPHMAWPIRYEQQHYKNRMPLWHNEIKLLYISWSLLGEKMELFHLFNQVHQLALMSFMRHQCPKFNEKWGPIHANNGLDTWRNFFYVIQCWKEKKLFCVVYMLTSEFLWI